MSAAGDDPPPEEAQRQLSGWLNGQGQLARWPAKQRIPRLALAYLVARFDRGRRYSEPEVNEVLGPWHLFHDPAILRRSLYDRGLMDRTPDGSAYWLAEDERLA